MDDLSENLQKAWKQNLVPVIFRRAKGKKLCIKLPYLEGNRYFLQNDRRNSPEWIQNRKYWETPYSWFNDLVNRLLKRHGKLYVIQPFREQEKCAPACMNAIGHECSCSCMGANHGVGNDGSWFEVCDSFATRWGEQHFACRLMSLKNTN